MTVAVPARAQAFAAKAVEAGWHVNIATHRGPVMGDDGKPRRYYLKVDVPEEEGGGCKVVKGDVREFDKVAVRCLRGTDYLYALWVDGSFDHAARPWALRHMSSAEALDHVLHSPQRPCRFIPSLRGGVCEVHGERRSL